MATQGGNVVGPFGLKFFVFEVLAVYQRWRQLTELLTKIPNEICCKVAVIFLALYAPRCWKTSLATRSWLTSIDLKTNVGAKAQRIRLPVSLLQRRSFQTARIVIRTEILQRHTRFTATAAWVAQQIPRIVRLRDFQALRNWLYDQFDNEDVWKEIPNSLQLAPDVTVTLPSVLRRDDHESK